MTSIRARRLSCGAAVRIGLNTFTGVAWGIGWATCASAFQHENRQIVQGYTLLPFQIGGLGLLLAVGAIVTLALVYHVEKPFWRAMLGGLSAASLTALLFYGGLALSAALFPVYSPSQLEAWLLPFGWTLDNAVLWLVMQHIDAPKQLEVKSAPINFEFIRIWSKRVSRSLSVVISTGVGMVFLVTQLALPHAVMLSIVPLFIWGGLAAVRELK